MEQFLQILIINLSSPCISTYTYVIQPRGVDKPRHHTITLNRLPSIVDTPLSDPLVDVEKFFSSLSHSNLPSFQPLPLTPSKPAKACARYDATIFRGCTSIVAARQPGWLIIFGQPFSSFVRNHPRPSTLVQSSSIVEEHARPSKTRTRAERKTRLCAGISIQESHPFYPQNSPSPTPDPTVAPALSDFTWPTYNNFNNPGTPWCQD